MFFHYQKTELPRLLNAPMEVFCGLSANNFTALMFYYTTREASEPDVHRRGWCSLEMEKIVRKGGTKGGALRAKKIEALEAKYAAGAAERHLIGPQQLQWFGPLVPPAAAARIQPPRAARGSA